MRLRQTSDLASEFCKHSTLSKPKVHHVKRDVYEAHAPLLDREFESFDSLKVRRRFS